MSRILFIRLHHDTSADLKAAAVGTDRYLLMAYKRVTEEMTAT